MASILRPPSRRERELESQVAELLRENAELRQENAELRELLQAALDRIAELEKTVAALTARLSQNSTNSHRSPSSDKPRERKSRRKAKKADDDEKGDSGKRKGGQPGHEGTTRELASPDEVDETIDCAPTTCECCGDHLPEPTGQPRRRLQVVDLLEVLTWLKEFRQHEIECPGCGTVNQGEVPNEATDSAFGPGIHALVAYLIGANRMSRRNVQDTLRDSFGIEVSLGALSKMEERVSDALEEPFEAALASVQSAKVVNADETPYFEKNQKAWLWAAVTGSVVVYLVRATRGMKVAREFLGDAFGGILGSDRAKCYLLIDMKHRQICWAHLKREFKKLVDAGMPGAEIGRHLEDDRKRLFEWWHRVRDGTMARSTFQKKVSKLRADVHALLVQHSEYEDDDPRCAAFLRELLKYEDALWTFTRVEGVEPTNNSGERAVRPGVIWRKISFGTQSERGSRFVERMLTTVGSLRKQKRSVLGFITDAYVAHRAGEAAPSLIAQ